jgi:hypothetical protein
VETNNQKQVPSTNTEEEDKQKYQLELLRFNYDNLQKAVWDCHKVSWTMTGIFIPAACTAMGILAKYMDGLDRKYVFFFAALILGFIVFWFLTISFLDHRNRRRFRHLKRLEVMFNKYLKGGDYEPIFQHHLRSEELRELGITPPRKENGKSGICSRMRDVIGSIKFYWLVLSFFIFLILWLTAILVIA